MAGVLGINPDEFRACYPANRASYDQGILTPARYWSLFAERARAKISQNQIEKLRVLDVQMWSNVRQEMVRWIKALSAAGLKTALLSNMIADMAAHARAKFTWLDQITCQVLSCELGLVKPDRAIYEHCLRALEVAPSEALFVDDTEVNVLAARGIGVRSIHFRSLEQFRQDLLVIQHEVPGPYDGGSMPMP